ncbi:MAG: hypothetical protein RSA74_12160, partial [Chryseobacterium sp.]
MKKNIILFTLLSFVFGFSQDIIFSKEKLEQLNQFNLENKSRAFIIFQNGKIINEKSFPIRSFITST